MPSARRTEMMGSWSEGWGRAEADMRSAGGAASAGESSMGSAGTTGWEDFLGETTCPKGMARPGPMRTEADFKVAVLAGFPDVEALAGAFADALAGAGLEGVFGAGFAAGLAAGLAAALAAVLEDDLGAVLVAGFATGLGTGFAIGLAAGFAGALAAGLDAGFAGAFAEDLEADLAAGLAGVFAVGFEAGLVGAFTGALATGFTAGLAVGFAGEGAGFFIGAFLAGEGVWAADFALEGVEGRVLADAVPPVGLPLFFACLELMPNDLASLQSHNYNPMSKKNNPICGEKPEKVPFFPVRRGSREEMRKENRGKRDGETREEKVMGSGREAWKWVIRKFRRIRIIRKGSRATG